MVVRKGYKQSANHVRARMDARLQTLRAKAKPVTAEWLRMRYWDDRATCVEIGAELSKDPKTILSWMRHYGIPTRPRGYTTEHLPKGREPGFHLSDEHREAVRQARLRDGHVPYLRDGQHWLATAAPDEHPNWKGGVTPERQAFYATVEWREAVKAVWARANARCERCGVHHNTRARRGTFHIHHIVSFAVRELRAEPSNLALLCCECHHFVHSAANIAREFMGEWHGSR